MKLIADIDLGGSVEVREQCDEHSTVQLLPPSVLAAQLHGRIHMVASFCWRER